MNLLITINISACIFSGSLKRLNKSVYVRNRKWHFSFFYKLKSTYKLLVYIVLSNHYRYAARKFSYETKWVKRCKSNCYFIKKAYSVKCYREKGKKTQVDAWRKFARKNRHFNKPFSVSDKAWNNWNYAPTIYNFVFLSLAHLPLLKCYYFSRCR